MVSLSVVSASAAVSVVSVVVASARLSAGVPAGASTASSTPLDESNSTDADATVTPGSTISEAIAQAEDTDVVEAPHTPIES